MKKKIAYILVAALIVIAGIGLGVSAFNNMNSNKPNTEVQGGGNEDDVSDEDLMKKAVAYVKTIYKDVAKETPNDFERIGTVPVGKVKFTVEWSVDVDENVIKIVKQDNGLVLIDINEEIADETPYVLTATISDSKGNSEKLTWNHVIPAKIAGSYQDIVDMAYALKNGESLPNIATLQGTVTTVNTPWDSGYKNITVTIVVEGREDKPIQCYRLKSGAADASLIEKGDLITVTGTLKNYNGTIEFDAGCVLDANEKGAGKIDKVSGSMQDIVDKAYALGKGEALKGEATLTGWVKSIDTPYSDQYKNITVTIVVDGRLDKPIQCYRLKGSDAAKIKVGDIITVTGNIKNYNGTIEFDAGCTLDKLVKGDGKAPETPVMSGSMQSIVDKAYKLAPGESFTEDAILTGKVTKVNTPWSSQYSNITVTIVVDGREDKPIKCYRLTGANADKIAKGDTITVKGIITNYQGSDDETGETWTEVEFKQGCQLIKWVQGVYVPPVIEDIEAPFKTGDKVVIWNPAYNKAFTTDVAASYYSAGANVNYSNGVLRNYPASSIFEIVENADKTYSFVQNGKKLSMADQYSSITLGDANDKWIITEADGGTYRIMNMKREAYIEWYDAKDYWSGYGTISGKYFDLGIYVIPDEVPPATLADAVAKLQADYAAEMTKNGEYALVPSINVDGTVFNVSWAIETADAAVANIVDGKLVIAASTEKDVAYTLKATVSDKTGSKDVVWTYTVAKVEVVEDDTNGFAPTKGIFTMYQGNADKTLYLNGEMDGYYFGTTEDIKEAVEVGTEEADGGVYLYIVKDGVKSYINIYKNGTYTNVGYTDAPEAVFVYNEEYDTYLTNVEGTNYFLGTRNDKTYTTFSACAEKYLSTNFIGHIKEVAIPYKYFTNQENLGQKLYLTGEVANKDYYFATTEDIAAAVDVYIEEVEGGVRFYFVKEGVKTYIDIYKNGSYVNARFTTEPTATFVYNETYNAYVADIEGTEYYLGTYSTYNTISASKLSYISTSFPCVFELSATGAYLDVESKEDGGETPDVPVVPTVDADDAIELLATIMADVKINAAGEYTLTSSVSVEGVEFNVTWKVQPDGLPNAVIAGDKLVVVSSETKDVEFTLVATVANASNEADTATNSYGPYVVPMAEKEETVVLEDGAQVVIYAPAYNKALSVTKAGNYNAGVDVTVTDGEVSGYADTEVWTVTVNADGTYSFTNGENKLSMNDQYTSLQYNAAHDTWSIAELGDGLYTVKNATRTNKYGDCFLQWSSYGNWSTYGSSDDAAAESDRTQLAFYIVEKPVLEAGDKVVIYAPAYNKALSVTKAGNYNAGVDVTVTDGKVSGYADTEVWTVIVNADGTYSFTNGENKLSMNDQYTSLQYNAAHDTWSIAELGNGLYTVKNATRTNKYGDCFLQWSSYGNWSTYGSSDDAAAESDRTQLAFYVIPAEPVVPDVPVVPDEPEKPENALVNGDQVVIYAPAYNKALSATKTGNYNVGVDVAVTDGVMTGYDEASVWTVIVNEDGTYSFANGGQNIGMADQYTSMNLGAVNDKWELIDLGDGLYNLKNVGRETYMEWYAKYSNWSTYGSSSAATDDQFQLAFYVIPTEKEASFVKVTEDQTDWSGTYLIVYEDKQMAFDGSLEKLDTVNDYKAVEITDGKIEATEETKAIQFTIEKVGDKYTIKSESGYYIGQNSNKNGLTTNKSTVYENTISINEDGSVNIIGAGGAYLRFNANSDQMRFRYYKSSSYKNQKAIVLYKLVEE